MKTAFLEEEVKAISDHKISLEEIKTTAFFYSIYKICFNTAITNIKSGRHRKTEQKTTSTMLQPAKTQFSLDKRKSYA